MSFFSRRFIQKMLNELSGHLNAEKRLDLIERLEKKHLNQNIPAEMELAILWAVSKTGDLDIGPVWWDGNGDPDGYSENIIPGNRVLFDITAVSNGNVSQKDIMTKVATRVCQFASTIERKFGKNLWFYFFEEGAITRSFEKRRVLVNEEYQLSDKEKRRISGWIKTRRYEFEPIRVHDQGVAFEIKYVKTSQSTPFVHTSMPPQCYSLTRNPIYSALHKKRDQLKGGDSSILKAIFLVDAGADLLSDIGGYIHRSGSAYQTYGPEIIEGFLSKYGQEIDVVIVVSAWDTRDKGPGLRGVRTEPNLWKVTVFPSNNSRHDWSRVEEILRVFPPPRMDANLARQHNFKPASGTRYKGAIWRKKKEPYMKQVKFSAGALRDLMAGDLKPEKFLERQTTDITRSFIKQHGSISSISLEKGLDNEDDDYVVLTFEEDPALKNFE